MKGQYFGSVDNTLKTYTDASKTIPEQSYRERNLMRGKPAGTGVWTQKECNLKVSEDLYNKNKKKKNTIPNFLTLLSGQTV